jgi:hypothetical protein
VGSLEKRVRGLEESLYTQVGSQRSGAAREAQALTDAIRILDAKIAVLEGKVPVAARESEDAVGRFMESLDGLDTDRKIEALDEEIARLEGEAYDPQ